VSKLLLSAQQAVTVQALQQPREMQCEALMLFDTQICKIEQQIPAELLDFGKRLQWLGQWDTVQLGLGDMKQPHNQQD